MEVTPSAPSCFKNDLRIIVVQPSKRRRQAEIHLASSSDVCHLVCLSKILLHKLPSSYNCQMMATNYCIEDRENKATPNFKQP